MSFMNNTTARTSTLSMAVPTTELMRSVLGSAWESYAWWSKVQYAPNCDWNRLPEDWAVNPDTLPYIYVELLDTETDDEATVRWLSVQDILNGVNAILKQCPWVRWDDMDAGDGDMVMQYALMGEVIYG